jgi:hypothetical protein
LVLLGCLGKATFTSQKTVLVNVFVAWVELNGSAINQSNTKFIHIDTLRI